MKKDSKRIKVTEEEKERRKLLRLPVTKELRYMKKTGIGYTEFRVVDYKVVDTYMPSETNVLVITLDTGDRVRILAPYFAEMQKPSFERDMREQEVHMINDEVNSL